MTERVQDLTHFIKQQIRVIEKPFKVDKVILGLIKKHESHNKRSKEAQVEKVLNQLHKKTSSYYHQFHSQQTIYQICDQIEQLWEDKNEERLDALNSLEKFNLPNDLQSSYKVYSIKDVLAQLETLPDLPVDEELLRQHHDDEINHYVKYISGKRELQQKVKRLRELKETSQKMRDYSALIDLKIGDRTSIQKNIPSAMNNEIHQEFTKLKIILEKLNNLSEVKKAKLKTLLEE